MIVALKEREVVQLCKAEQAPLATQTHLSLTNNNWQQTSYWQVHTLVWKWKFSSLPDRSLGVG